MGGVLILVITGSLYAFREEPDTQQGMVEVTNYRVSSKVPARILRYYVDEGDYVKAGDTLVVLEAPDVAAKLKQAEAARTAAEAQDRKAIKGARQEQISAALAMWQKSKAGVEIAEKSYHRVKSLHEPGVMTAQKLDEVKAQYDAAVSTERAAKSQYDMALNGAELEEKQAAAAMVQRAQGAVNEVNAYVKETVLTASMDGEVTEIFPQVGELVGTGAPIMNIDCLDKVWVTFNVREDLLKRFAVGTTFQGVVPALGDKQVTLKVYALRDLGSYAVWKATKTTGQYDRRTFEVRAHFVTPVDGLRPGMSVLEVSR